MIMNKILKVILPCVILMGCSANLEEANLNNSNTSTSSYISEIATAVDNTLNFETMQVKQYVDGSAEEYDEYLLSQNPNMGYSKPYRGDGAVFNAIQNIYIEDENVQGSIMDTKYLGEEDGVLKFEPLGGTIFNRDFGEGNIFNIDFLGFGNLKYIASNPENISNITKGENIYTLELSPKYFETQKEITLEQIQNMVDNPTNSGNEEFDKANKEMSIRLKKLTESEEGHKGIIKIEIVDNVLKNINSTFSYKSAEVLEDDSLSKEKVEQKGTTIMEVIKFNDNDNIRNEINIAYESTK